MYNKEISERTNTNYVFVAVKEEGGDNLAMFSVLKRTPPGKREEADNLAPGKKLWKKKLSWLNKLGNELDWIAQIWRRFVDALSSRGSEIDWLID